MAIEIGVTANNSVRLWGCTTLKIGKPSRIRPCITPLYTSRLYRVLIPGPCGYRHNGKQKLYLRMSELSDRALESVRGCTNSGQPHCRSCGPIGARCVTVDHLQLDLTALAALCVYWAVSFKLQAASLTGDLR